VRNSKRLYIDGQWTPSSGSQTIEVINPASGQVVGLVPAGTPEDIDLAVKAAQRALRPWSDLPVAQRGTFLDKICLGLRSRAGEIARSITDEVGMPAKLAEKIQAALPVAVMDSYATLVKAYPFEEQLGHSLVLKEAVGVVGCITPWNYPLHQAVAKVAPALAAGCTVVLKPSEQAPSCTFILAEIIAEAGLPAGVFNLVSGVGAVAGEALARHPDVNMVSFTGSTRAGQRVAELAAVGVKRLALELGGKSAALILEGADLPRAVKGTVSSCFLNSGQTCSAHSRLLVPERLYPEVARLAVEVAESFVPGDPYDAGTRLGPLVSSEQRDRVLQYIRRGIEEGAELLLGGLEAPAGLETGYYVRPTVFGRVTPAMTIAQEEIFGPVLSILTYRDEHEALRIANDTRYGLAGGVWAGDTVTALRAARKMRAGQIDINGAAFNLLAPFGGFGQSGYGRELGRYGLEEFLEAKSIQIRD
jgi:aldehyde dehydrogenase (NAD+)